MTIDRRRVLLSGGAALAGCASTDRPEREFSDAARAIYRKSIVFDANLSPPPFQVFPVPAEVLTQVGPSGLTVIKCTVGGFNYSAEDTLYEIAVLQRLILENPKHFRHVASTADIAAAKAAGQTGILLGFESVVALQEDVERIVMFSDVGVRVMQLSYNDVSPFGAGVLAPPEATLTELGRQAVAKMNEIGVALDLSHANPATTTAAIEASVKPVLVTHAGCAAVHPHLRHKTDDQLRAVAEKGGVVGLYNLFYLAPAGRQPNLDDYFAHLTHALNVCGEDHVGIGSDTAFGGFSLSAEDKKAWADETARRIAAGIAAPEEDGRLPYVEGLNRPDRALVIADGLLSRGYPARVVEKVLGLNFVRALDDIWS